MRKRIIALLVVLFTLSCCMIADAREWKAAGMGPEGYVYWDASTLKYFPDGNEKFTFYTFDMKVKNDNQPPYIFEMFYHPVGPQFRCHSVMRAGSILVQSKKVTEIHDWNLHDPKFKFYVDMCKEIEAYYNSRHS